MKSFDGLIGVVQVHFFSLLRRGLRAFPVGESAEKSECRRNIPWKAEAALSSGAALSLFRLLCLHSLRSADIHNTLSSLCGESHFVSNLRSKRFHLSSPLFRLICSNFTRSNSEERHGNACCAGYFVSSESQLCRVFDLRTLPDLLSRTLISR